MQKLTRKGFVAWLRSKHPRTKVGQSLSGLRKCPLAKFTGANVGIYCYWFDRGAKTETERVLMPVWAQKFVIAVDTFHGQKRPQITAKKALELLEEATQ
ncbi:hypothetical protein LCGC14_1973780 [marine sediment metagenome]|uniref:Uncharacterized protein n=1 Tax=marine sediment metagenome TaxID=412755 RepID=A0A0F9FAY0_9ZZZZ